MGIRSLPANASLFSQSEQQLRTLYEAVPCGVLVRNNDGRIIFANGAAQRILGSQLQPERDLYWMPTASRFREDGTPLSDDETPGRRVWKSGQAIRGFVMRIVSLDGAERWLHVDAVPVAGPDEGSHWVVTSFIDITERKLAELTLQQQALHDHLTGLPNRTLLLDRLSQAMLMLKRSGGGLGLLFFDLNRFKVVNDTLGHQAGDHLLQEVAGRFERAGRRTDTVARLGGDEFGVLLPSATRASAVLVARKLVAALEPPFMLDGRPVHVSASAGIALAPDHGSDPETLVRRADLAMYVSKRLGSDYSIYTADDEQIDASALDLEAELRGAIDSNQLVLHYQPIIELSSGRRVALEALVRWRHPERGLLAPATFIPIAEESGLIRPLTDWVLNEALRECRRWRDRGLDMRVAVNVSTRQLRPTQLADIARRSLDTWNVEPKSLQLELTEGPMLSDPEAFIAAIAPLRRGGMRLAMDNFGTGCSSLTYLQQLSPDDVKMGRAFVAQMREDERARAIVRSTIGLCHDLRIGVIAEGVEDEDTDGQLVALGCDAAQGFLYGRPAPADELEPWVGRGRAARP